MGPKHRTSNIQSGSSPPRAKPLGGEGSSRKSRNWESRKQEHAREWWETHGRLAGDTPGITLEGRRKNDECRSRLKPPQSHPQAY